MRGARQLVATLVMAALLAGCSDGPRPRADKHPSASPTESPPDGGLDLRIALLLKDSKTLERVLADPSLTLDSVEYTSPTDAAAEFWDCHKQSKDVCTEVILTTHDNWAHRSGIAIPDTVADLVDFTPLGGGSVAIKAEDQIENVSYPPFIIRPDGTGTPLHLSREPRDPAAGNFLADLWQIAPESGTDTGTWAVDLDAAEAFPLRHMPSVCCATEQNVLGRDGVVFSVGGYKRRVGDGAWRFDTSTDNARTWRTTDVRLPLGGRRLDNNAMDAIGPEHLQAIAILQWVQDEPDRLTELWLTDDEQAFHRVPLSRTPKDLGGIAFALDGALLLGEASGHRLWRLPRGATSFEPVPDAPRLSDPDERSTLLSSGGVVIARTGRRTISISTDGSTWTQVKPGA